MNRFISASREAFPNEVNIQAAAAARIKTYAYLSKRLDLRGKTTFCFVNSPDDYAHTAFSVERNNSGWTLGVHIADVDEYVCDGSPIDIEAKKRCATVSDGITKSEMLPERIVSDICDLSKDGDKLTLSFLLDIDSSNNVSSVKCEESVIRASNKCVYSELEELLHAQNASSVMLLRKKYEYLSDKLLEMYELAAQFTNFRKGRRVPDWLNSYIVYERSSEGKITSYRFVDEPDLRAVVKEIGYFVSNCVGSFFSDKKFPIIFTGSGAGIYNRFSRKHSRYTARIRRCLIARSRGYRTCEGFSLLPIHLPNARRRTSFCRIFGQAYSEYSMRYRHYSILFPSGNALYRPFNAPRH